MQTTMFAAIIFLTATAFAGSRADFSVRDRATIHVNDEGTPDATALWEMVAVTPVERGGIFEKGISVATGKFTIHCLRSPLTTCSIGFQRFNGIPGTPIVIDVDSEAQYVASYFYDIYADDIRGLLRFSPEDFWESPDSRLMICAACGSSVREYWFTWSAK